MAPKKRPAIERFNEKIKYLPNGCHEWTADSGNSGYGRFWVAGTQKALAHRWAYEYHVGPIPDGLVIDHLCRHKLCVNPEHLEAVTMSENVLRGEGPAKRSAMRFKATHCKNGHEYTPENTVYKGKKTVVRVCRTCQEASRKAEYERNRDKIIERSRQWRIDNPERARELSREGQRRYRARKKMEQSL